MLERNITRESVLEVILSGELIMRYDEDKPFPSILLFKVINNKPIHVLISVDNVGRKIFIITAYEPDSKYFESDFRTRRKL